MFAEGEDIYKFQRGLDIKGEAENSGEGDP